jgi:hypothetical protein
VHAHARRHSAEELGLDSRLLGAYDQHRCRPDIGTTHRPDHSLADRTLARARYHVATMIVTETAAGTPVIDLTPEEEAAYLEREVQSAVGMSVPEFIRAYSAGELDDADVAVDEMVGLLRIGQNGHKAAA